MGLNCDGVEAEKGLCQFQQQTPTGKSKCRAWLTDRRRCAGTGRREVWHLLKPLLGPAPHVGECSPVYTTVHPHGHPHPRPWLSLSCLPAFLFQLSDSCWMVSFVSSGTVPAYKKALWSQGLYVASEAPASPLPEPLQDLRWGKPQEWGQPQPLHAARSWQVPAGEQGPLEGRPMEPEDCGASSTGHPLGRIWQGHYPSLIPTF